MKPKTLLFLVVLTLCWPVVVPVEAAPPGSAFTYQGRLNDGGLPANGSYDLRAILYTSDIGGSQVGPIVTAPVVSVVNGVFTIDLNFETGAFNGDARWLELALRRTGGPGLPSWILGRRLRRSRMRNLL